MTERETRQPRDADLVQEELSAFLDGELAGEARARLEAELVRSPELRERLAALRAVDEALRALPLPDVPASLRARLLERVTAEDTGSGRRPRRLLWLGASAAAAAALAAWLVTTRLGDTPTTGELVLGVEPEREEDVDVVEVLEVLEAIGELEDAPDAAQGERG